MIPDDLIKSRLEALEMRVAYQDQAIEDLNAAVTGQWTLIDDLTRRLSGLANRIQTVEDAPGADPSQEPPPPHY